MFPASIRLFFRSAGRSSLPLTLSTTSTGVRYLSRSTHVAPSHQGSLLFAVLSSSLVSGVLGYTLSRTTLDQNDYLESPKYGSPRDFEKGIKELQEAFPHRDIVSTDPEVLEVHGATTNTYHPGW